MGKLIHLICMTFYKHRNKKAQTCWLNLCLITNNHISEVYKTLSEHNKIYKHWYHILTYKIFNFTRFLYIPGFKISLQLVFLTHNELWLSFIISSKAVLKMMWGVKISSVNFWRDKCIYCLTPYLWHTIILTEIVKFSRFRSMSFMPKISSVIQTVFVLRMTQIHKTFCPQCFFLILLLYVGIVTTIKGKL
jgi:hypothetical protein